NPDELAETVGAKDMPYLGAEGFQYVAGRVYKAQTGQELPDADPPYEPPELVNVGEPIESDDPEEMAARFPRLVAKLPEMGD
ncbi:MAG TPA: hypothetical protein VF796_12495, partial [Humisphaera sp.]